MELDLASLPTLTVVQLRGLCIERGLPATTDLRKQILITSLTAWAEAQEVESEEAPEEGERREDASSNHSGEGRHLSLSEDEEERSSVNTVTRGRPKASGRKGVLSRGENPSIRERELEAQLAYIALEAEKLALEKKKWAYKEKRDGSSDKEAEVSMGGGVCPRLPKGVVPAYVEGDDIDKWLGAFERALQMRRVRPQYWGSLLWELVPNSGRDRLLTLRGEEADSYPSMKRCLAKKFGLNPEQYRMKFRDTQKVSTQSWVDFVDISLKALEGWIIDNKVDTYEGLYNLIMREHILTNCTQERLRQHLVDSKQTNPRELGEAADEWLRTRVVVKSQGGDSKKGGTGPHKPKEGGGKPTTETPSVPQNPKKEESKSHSHSDQQRQLDPGLKKLLDSRACFDCQQTGHFRGDAACPKKVVSTGLSSVGIEEDSSDDEVLLALCWETGPDGKLVIPEGGSRHFHHIQVNGIPTTGLRDTCASHTIVSDRLVTPDMYVPGKTKKVRIATGEVTSKPVAVVPLEREGILDWIRVVVSADLPLDCILGNDLPEVSLVTDGVVAQGAPPTQSPGESVPTVRRQGSPRKGKKKRKGRPLLKRVPGSQGPSAPVGGEPRVGTGEASPDPKEVLSSQAAVQMQGVVPALTEGRVEGGCLPQEVVAPHSRQQEGCQDPKVAPKAAQPPVSGELRVWFWVLTAVSSLCWVLAFLAALYLAWEADPRANSKVGPLTLLVMVGLLKCWVTSLGKLGVALAKFGVGEVGTSLPKLAERKEEDPPRGKFQFVLGPFTAGMASLPIGSDPDRRI
ncbi:hypothetical protein NDU88_001673 [Pleurodeles waltl]|uniref:Uncharacterized protein n=1 Tax=Pleurodeles waltl TaxID=8319 RepID=A0AAV7LA62_PLEWA|nr:hypothetical protein NDU88_001673 [Pleurodeles waltl]